jgi:hypothetical protein
MLQSRLIGVRLQGREGGLDLSTVPITNIPGDSNFWYQDPAYRTPYAFSLPLAPVPPAFGPVEYADADAMIIEYGSQWDGTPGGDESNWGMMNAEINLLAYSVQLWSAICNPAPLIAGNIAVSLTDGFGSVGVGTPV